MHNAAYDCGARADSRCFEGTRVQIVEEIGEWAERSADRPIGWLKGPAGFGKSAIARTVTHRWDRAKVLAGSFCFFRNAGDQSKATRLVPTLSYQLTLSIPETKQTIEESLVNDPSLLNRELQQQFQRLLIDPILALPRRIQSTMFIVIDALDECDDREFIPQLLRLIASIDYSTFPIRFFFTSRSEEHIRKIFESAMVNHQTYRLSISNVGAYQDIKIFLKAQFDIIYAENRQLMSVADIKAPWPLASDLDDIVRKANGSFLFAATLTKYIGTGTVPPQRLKIVVDTHTGVNGMYCEIIQKFWNDEHFPTVFSTIMLLEDPLSITELGALLELTGSDILIEVLKIQSILIVPSDDHRPVEIVHTSLRDFSISRMRAGNFLVDIPTNQLFIGVCCLKVMVANPEGVVVFEKDPTRYASSHWHKHLLPTLNSAHSNTLQHDLVLDHLNQFASQAYEAGSNTVLCARYANPLKYPFSRDTVHMLEVSPFVVDGNFSNTMSECAGGVRIQIEGGRGHKEDTRMPDGAVPISARLL